MIIAIVRYQIPADIDHDTCLAHYVQIAPGFHHVPGLLSKYFIWSEGGTAGGIYHWTSRAQAEAFYGGSWREGIIARYGMPPEIEYFTTFALTDNLASEVRVFEVPMQTSGVEE